MDWELVYLSMFRCVVHDNGEKEAIEIASHQELETSQESLHNFLESMLKQIKSKRPSLAPTASCRAFKFHDEEVGKEDQKVVDQLLNAVSISSFESHARILATKYIQSPKSRQGILFIVTANTAIKKNLSPGLFVFKTDFQKGFIPFETGVTSNNQIILPELKKGLIYPYHDGLNFHFDKIQLFQKSQSEYFQKMFRLVSLPDSEEIADEALKEQLENQSPGTYEKYFKIPRVDRNAKREVFGQTRTIQQSDLLNSDMVSHLSKKTQMKVVDQNVRPIKLRLNVDDGIRFEGRVDQINQSFFFAEHGLEKYLIIRGSKFETRSHFQSVEFMKLEQLDEIMTRIAADEPSKIIEIEPSYSEDEEI
tara:strand:+ start:94 stop:1185 length:1092 start_codon:yes stop_codon:yes gene_type:complete